MNLQNDILTNLEKIGFSKKESEIYLELVKNPNSNGSKIAKKLGYPRTSIYQILSLLQQKGYVLSFMEGEITSYVAVSPKEILSKYKKEVDEAVNFLDDEFDKIHVATEAKQFYNLNSLTEVNETIRNLLKNTENIVYINTNMDLKAFSKEFKALKKKGVNVIMFSFQGEDYSDLGIHNYSRESFDCITTENTKRFMMSVDFSSAMIASDHGGVFKGTYSENILLANIITEHIRNDIHIMKLEKKYGKQINQDMIIDLTGDE